MINKSPHKSPMPTQNQKNRVFNFNEVALGYALEEALSEAKRCLDCRHKPCITECPVEIDIPAFIRAIADQHLDKAYRIISDSSVLPAVCGRVCPQESQCEAVCVRGIKGEPVAIGHLERFVADYYFTHHAEIATPITRDKEPIAVVGSGPAGLSCAHDLVKKGYQVTLFEALHQLGGVLVYGIPEFRLPKEIVKREIHRLIDLGVKIEKNVIIGQSLFIKDLFDMGYKAVFLGTGAGLPKFMNIPGEMLNGVYSANEFLTRINLMKAYQKDAETPIFKGERVAVIGGGNVALDAARSAKRLGANHVMVIYRRSMKELPARIEEVHHAKDEQIQFHLLTHLKEIIGDENGHVKRIRLVEMTLGEPDESGRRRPIEKKDSDFFMDVDTVIMAIGTRPNPMIMQSSLELEKNAYGCLVTDPNTGETTMPMVYAGGDVVTGSATVILAMGAGRKAAKAIDEKLNPSF